MENYALYCRIFDSLPDDLLDIIGTGAEHTRSILNDGSASYVYSWDGLTVTCNVMPPEQIEGHLAGFAGYIYQIYQGAPDERGQAIIQRILETSLVIAVIVEGGGDEPNEADALIGNLIAYLEPIIFYGSALYDGDFSLLLGPDGAYDPESTAGNLDNETLLDLFDPESDLSELSDDVTELLTQFRPTISSEQIAADSLTKMAESSMANEDYDTALLLYQQALSTLRRAFDEEHPSIAAALGNLAEFYLETGDYESALQTVQQELAIERKAFGEADLELSITLDILAWLYRQTGNLEQALSPLQEALNIRRQTLGDHHPDVANNLNNLAMFFSDSGDYEQALSLSKEALDIQRQAFGNEHPDVATSLHNQAGMYHDQGDNETALPLYQEALAIRRRMLKPDDPEISISLRGLAALHWDMGDYQSALSLWEEDLSNLRQTFGDDDIIVAYSSGILAESHFKLGDYPKARSLYEKELSILQQAYGDDHPDVAMSMNNLATVYESEGEYQKSLALLQRALSILRQTMGDNHPEVAIGLANVASLQVTRGEYKQSFLLYQEALSIAQKTLPSTSPIVADIQGKLADLYKKTGDFSKALAIHQQALETQIEVLGTQHPDVAASYSLLANLYMEMGDLRSAEHLNQSALDIQLHIFGDKHPVVAYTLDNQGQLYVELGQYQKALPLHQQALAIMRQALGDKHPDIAVGLSNLAELYAAMGDPEQALDLYQQALKINREALGDEHREVAVVMDNAAKLLQSIGEYEQALSLHQRALAILREALGDHHHDVAIVLDNLASCYRGMRRYEQALPLYQQALAIEQSALGETHPEVARCLFSLAELDRATGNFEQAQHRYQEALSILKKTLGEAGPLIDDILLGLGIVHTAVGQEKTGLSVFKEANAIQTLRLGTVFSVSTERQRSGFLQTIQNTYFTYLTALLRLEEMGSFGISGKGPEFPMSEEMQSIILAQAALELVFQRKGVEAEAQVAQRGVILEGRYPQLRPRLHDLEVIQARLIEVMLAEPVDEETESRMQYMADLKKQRDEVEIELVQQIPELNLTQQLLAANGQAVAEALPSGTALVEFVQFRPFNFQAIQAHGEDAWQPARYLAFILHSGVPENVKMVDLGEARSIDRLVAGFRATIAGGDRQLVPGGRKGSRVTIKDTGESLRATVFDPLLPALDGCQRIFLAPDGDLTRIPFEALSAKDDRCLIDDYRITYLSTGRDLLRLSIPSNGQPTAPLVVADPDFDLRIDKTSRKPGTTAATERQSRDLDQNSVHFNRLPGTRIEGERIAALLGVRPLLGERVLESRLKGRRSPRILHIATHGFFLSDQAHDRSDDQFVPRTIGKPADGGIGRLTRPENPLLRSGLALAGANTWLRGELLPKSAEDAILNGEDVAGLDLLDTDLVVLSACETGLGEVKVGEGVFGMRRAFVLAGAKTLIMSLWKIPDLQTQELMIDFYNRILAGEPLAEALRQAQLAMKARYPNPLYWGAFICQGNPGSLEIRVNR